MTVVTPTSEPGFVALEGGGARVEVVPRHGGYVRSLRLGGREWLLQGKAPNGRARGAGEASVDPGWNESAQATVLHSTPPSGTRTSGPHPAIAIGMAPLPHPEIALVTGTEGHVLTCTWHGEHSPWMLTRTLLVRHDGAVEVRYEALTTGAQRLAFLWRAQLLFPLAPGTHLRLPESGRFRIGSVVGAKVFGVRDGTWPLVTLDGKARDLSTPWSVPRKTLLNGWFDLGGGRAMFQVRQDDARLTISTDGAGIPHCGILIDRDGSRHGARRSLFARGEPPALALSPSLGAADRYGDAPGDRRPPVWLVPGEPRRWTMTFRAGL